MQIFLHLRNFSNSRHKPVDCPSPCPPEFGLLGGYMPPPLGGGGTRFFWWEGVDELMI